MIYMVFWIGKNTLKLVRLTVDGGNIAAHKNSHDLRVFFCFKEGFEVGTKFQESWK